MSDLLNSLLATQKELGAMLATRPKLFDLLSGKWRVRLAGLASSCGDDLARLQQAWSARDRSLADLEQQLAASRHALEAVTASRDDLLAKLDQVIAHRDEIAQQMRQVEAHRDELAGTMAGIATLRDSLIRQVAGLQAQIASQRQGGADGGSTAVWLRTAYLDLMEKVLTGEVTSDPPINLFGNDKFDREKRWRGLDWPQHAKSMIGAVRMHNVRHLVELAILDGLPGDIVEAGVWRGGASIMAKAVIEAYGDRHRKVYLADSFEGLPPPNAEKYPHDAGLHLEQYADLSVSEEQVRANFAEMGLLDDRVVTVKGWFRDTMPTFPVERIAVLRLDGDLYESTIDPLNHLYDKVSAGGWVIIDDYDCFEACKAAVHDFLGARGLNPEIHHIDGVGAYFRKA